MPDQRIAIKPSEQDNVLLNLISFITGNKKFYKGKTIIDDKLSKIAAEIRTRPEELLLFSDSNDKKYSKNIITNK